MECFTAAAFTLCLVYAILNESVKLSADSECTAQKFSLSRALGDGSPRTVATLVNGVWMPEDRYRGRVEHSSTPSLWLNRVNYNDKGHYEFTCAGQVVTIIKLEVLVISNNNLSVTEGDTVTLPCYFQTAGDSVDSFEWERNGELVFNQSPSGERRYGTGFEGRVSVRSDWAELGELSLTVEGVKPEDRGDFFCFVREGSRQRRERGIHAAVRVTVNERKRAQTTSAPVPPTHEAPQSNATVIAAVVTFFITAAVFGLLAGLVWYRRNRNLRRREQTDVETSQHGEDKRLRSNGYGPPAMAKEIGGG